MGRREARPAPAPEGQSRGRGEDARPRRPPTERWLLTRKTWRYMADAGRRLIPDGISGDRPEDIPKIRDHFSRLCRKEPRFLLWRKASFPGASPAARSRGRRRKEGRAGSEEPPPLETLVEGTERTAVALGLPGSALRGEGSALRSGGSALTVGGSAPESTLNVPSTSSAAAPDWALTIPAPPPTLRIDSIDRWVQTEPIPEVLMRRIEEAATEGAKEVPKKEVEAAKEADAKGRRGSCPRDDLSPSVGDTIMRYLRMARKKSVDGDKSEKFRTVNYDRVTVKISEGCSDEELIDGGLRRGIGVQSSESWLKVLKSLGTAGLVTEGCVQGMEVCGVGEREEVKGVVAGETARLTVPVSPPIACPITSSSPPSSSSTAPASPPSSTPASPPREPPHPPSFLAQLLHGLQHHHNRHSAPPSPVLSPPTPSSPPPTAGSLPVLSAAAAAAASASGAPPVAAMQKSKSSSSVVASLAGRGPGGLVAKRIWRPRSRSTQGRTSPTTAVPASPPSAWIPQGCCRWNCVETGRQVALTDTNLLMLSEVERRVLQKVALAKLQALNLGASVRIPTGEEAAVAAKPRRRPYLLRRKARTTTSPLDARRSGDVNTGSGLVFGIPISQCIENETAAGRSGRDSGGSSSRSSAGSLTESTTSPPSPRRDSSDERPREGVEWRWSDGWPEEGAPPHPRVPQVVLACLSHIREHGLHTLGIFRVGSSKKRVRQLREDLDMGRDTDLSASQCPHDVAALLKEYFRDLPEPLLCRELYTAFVRTQGIRNRRLQFEALQHLVQLLPPPHRDTLCLLLDFLAIVARHAEDKRDPHSGEWLSGNKMDSGNLATLFAPNILRRTTGDFHCDSRDEAAEDRLDVINVVRCMIEHNRDLFAVPAELLDEVYVHMMDTHPEALDDLLRSRCPPQAEEIWDDHLISDGVEQQVDVHGTPPRRRMWSREEFLHGTAGMGGPDLAMMPRHRSREGKGSKKRTKEPQLDSAPRGKAVSEERPRGGSVADIRTVRGGDRSEELAGGRRGAEEEDAPDAERGVITASLRIPVPAHVALEDIPFIEDGVSEVGRAPPPPRPSPSSSLPPSPIPSAASLAPPSDRQVPSPIVQPPPIPTTLSVPQLPHTGAAAAEGRPPAPETDVAIVPAPVAESAPLERRGEAQPEGKSSPEEAMTEATRRGAIRSMTTVDMARRQRSATRAEAAEAERRYARRRYTDGRHVAAALPEVASPRGPVWKRREIIASEPRRRTAQ